MKILGVNCILPSNKISNDEIIDLVGFYSKTSFKKDINELKKGIQQMFDSSGIVSRYWRAKSERPLDFINQSFQELLKETNFDKDKIDTIIYTSVDRGFIEPANACFIAKKIDLTNVRTFDIVDACMGWTTAMQIAQSLINNEEANNVLIVTSEFPMDPNGTVFPKNFEIQDIQELRWKFPSFTIGEAASTTLVCKSEKNAKYFFDSDSSNADLCTIPLYKFHEYSDKSPKLNNKEEFVFSAYGRELYFAGYKKAIEVLKKALEKTQREIKAILPHSVSLDVPKRVGERLDMSEKIFTVFPKIGNVATSSIPSTIYFGQLMGKFKKGDTLLGWVASGGLKYSAFEIFI